MALFQAARFYCRLFRKFSSKIPGMEGYNEEDIIGSHELFEKFEAFEEGAPKEVEPRDPLPELSLNMV